MSGRECIHLPTAGQSEAPPRAVHAHPRHRRRGVIFITALAIITILAGVVLVFAQRMRVEAIASANQLSASQADAIEQGAEQWVMGLVDTGAGDAVTITQTPAEALQLGGGYFWILHPDSDDYQSYQFGVTDEQGKLNLNTVTSDQLQTLTTSLTPDVADAILDWRNPATSATGDGAETDYYQTLPDPYDCKNDSYETVDELLLVRGITPQILYGYDTNHNGVLDAGEQAAGGLTASLNSSTNDPRGLFPFVTVYSVTTAATGGASSGNAGKTTSTGTTGTKTTGTTGTTGRNAVSVSPINVNTAPLQVLQCIDGLSQADAQTLVSARQSNSTAGSTTWVATALGQSTAQAITPYITGTSNRYSADIVAVSGDGRAFRRVRIVVDDTAAPPKILYRRDLTGLGWPLTKDIRDALRSSKPPPLIGVQQNGIALPSS